jgi:Type I phosphodiesterase / nucleotide pyrophosphatase
MANPKGLVIIHVDGLGYDYLQQALAQGRMPFVQRLIAQEDYVAQPYRCGVPSTTPFCQAGILYGDNSEIPSFRWWDKESGLLVAFGSRSSFRRVAHKYFKGCDPLTRDGACIAACYPGASADSFGIAYQERGAAVLNREHSIREVLASWATNPLHLLDWTRRGLVQIWKANVQYWRARVAGQPTAKLYVISDMLEEIFLHQLTRVATLQAMRQGYPTIYAGYYAYDETAHAYGPDSDYAFHILRHIDNSIRRVGERRRAYGREYEVVVLSDHGQVETVPFEKKYGKRFGDMLAEWLPTYEVEEYRGKKRTPPDALDGHLALTYSGGLAHLYFKNISWRMERGEIEARYPGLISKIGGTEGIGFVLLRDGASDLLVTREGTMRLGEGAALNPDARDFLARFDQPTILARQLHTLNSFQRAGDLIIFGAFVDGKQINFEEQVGGHGSVGGAQLHPFVLAKREWSLDTSRVTCASDLYPLLKGLRDELLR